MTSEMEFFHHQTEESDIRTLIDGFAKFVAKNGIEFENLAKEKHVDNPQFSFLFGGNYFPYYQQKLNEARLAENSDVEPDTTVEQHDPLISEFEQTIKPIISQCTKESISNGKSWILAHFRTQEGYNQISHLLLMKTTPHQGVSFFDRLHIVYLINDVLHHCIRKNNQELRKAIQQNIPQIFSNCSRDATQENLKKLDKLVKIWRSQSYFEEAVLVSLDFIISQRESELANENTFPKNEPQQAQLPSTPYPPYPPHPSQFSENNQAPIRAHHSASSHPIPQGSPHIPPNHQFPPHPTLHRPPFPPGGEGQKRLLFRPQHFPAHQNRYNYFPHHPPHQNLPNNPGYEMTRHPGFPVDNVHSWPRQRPPFPFNPHEHSSHLPPMSPSNPREPFPPHKPYPPVDPQMPPINPEMSDYEFREVKNEPLEIPPGGPHPFTPPTYSNESNFPDWPHKHFPHDRLSPHQFNREMGFANREQKIVSPYIPYYDLPAGLVALLVPLEEHEYTPIDPSLIQLPLPQQPSQRLLKAVENFYAPPTDDNSRNKRGWEAKALLDFFEAKRMSSIGRNPFSNNVSLGGADKLCHSTVDEKDEISHESSRGSPSSRSRSRSRSSSTGSGESHFSPSASPSRLDRKRSLRSTSEAYPTHSDEKCVEIEECDIENRPSFSSHSLNPYMEQDNSRYDDKYAGVGSDSLQSDIYEQYRRSKSYTYNRKPSSKRSGYSKSKN